MKTRHLISALAGAVAGAALTAATLAWAQTPAQSARAGDHAPAKLQALNADTFVSIKDHGESQTVIVYKVDDKGTARLTHKAKFFY